MEQLLNGSWKIALDPENSGKDKGWMNEVQPEAIEAFFPSMIQDNFREFKTGVAWYWTEFSIDEIPEDSDCFIKAGNTEPIAEFWLNGKYLGRKDGRLMFYDLLCTDAIKTGTNLLAIRIVMPGDEEIDGYTFREVPAIFGSVDNAPFGGIHYEIRAAFRPKQRIDRAVAIADMHTGDVSVDLYIHNPHKEGMTLYAEIRTRFDEIADSLSTRLSEEEAINTKIKLHVNNPELWDTEKPALYELKLYLISGEGKIYFDKCINIGFREFIVNKDGWFVLNGKRRFFSSTYVMDSWHSMGAMESEELQLKELTQLKSMGFDSIRFHNYVGRPEILDMCDRMGIIVIEAHGGSWLLKKDNKYFEQMFYDHLLETVKHDINHPSILAWELINEYHYEGQIPVEALKPLRDIDMTRLVFLGSGRWDNDMRVGSVSNPGSREWECLWGAEDPNAAPPVDTVKTLSESEGLGSWTWEEDDLCCWQPQLGDVHIYPRIPMTWRGKWVLRNHAKGLKPAFVSETGHNSMADSLSYTRRLEQEERLTKNEKVVMGIQSAEFLQKEWERFGLDEIYTFPEEMVREANMQNARTRTLQLESIRSNPQFAGLCNSCLSGPYSGFGALNWFRERQPYIAETIGECLAPLRWCVFIEPNHVYRGQKFTVEAVLANNEVLKEGTYPACARITSRGKGKIWEKKADVVIKKENGYIPFATPVLKEEICLDIEEGEYDFCIYLEHGGAALGGRKKIYVSEYKEAAGLSVAAIGLSDETISWFAGKGVDIRDDADVIIVGDMKEDDAEWDSLYRKAENGAKVIFMKPQAFLNDVEEPYDYFTKHEPKRLPFAQKGLLHFTDNWAYRVHTVMKNTPYSEGMTVGILNDELFDQTEPMYIYEDVQFPDKITAVTLAPLYIDKSSDEVHGWVSGIAIGEYKYGKGSIVLNTFRILKELGKNPYADRLMINLIKG